MKDYKKILVLFFLMPMVLFGQNVVKNNISISSGEMKNGFSLSYTVGSWKVPNPFLTSVIIKNKNKNKNIKSQSNEKFNMAVFPNPVGTVLNVAITSKDEFNDVFVGIYDLKGNLLISKKDFSNYASFYKISVRTNFLPQGIYYVKVILNNKIEKNIKILKN